ncbi:MAG: GNAT family N-acetyltransferase [archaeon GB-1867-035]|nr:GNAT family N-acetyltransferase [Candidatus Culexmicrobium profundum]
MSQEIIVVNYSTSYLRDLQEILSEYRDPTGRTLSRDEIDKIISSAVEEQPDGIFIAISRRDVVGLLIASLNRFGVACIDHLQVRRDWTGKKVEYKLMDKCLSWAKRKGARIIYAKVADNDTTAIELYRKSGFKISGYIPRYYGKDVDAIIFVRQL